MEEIKDIIDSNKDTIKRNLTAQNSNRLSKSIGFFDEITSSEKPTEKKRVVEIYYFSRKSELNSS